MASVKTEKNLSRPLLWILLAIAFIWARSSVGKLLGGEFVGGMEGTLTKFASNNPYSFYKQFLNDIAIPNSELFGIVVLVGEALVAAALVIGVLNLLFVKSPKKIVVDSLLLGLLGGLLLNLMFWLASGWMSPSGDGLNLLMLVVEMVGFLYLLRVAKA